MCDPGVETQVLQASGVANVPGQLSLSLSQLWERSAVLCLRWWALNAAVLDEERERETLFWPSHTLIMEKSYAGSIPSGLCKTECCILWLIGDYFSNAAF